MTLYADINEDETSQPTIGSPAPADHDVSTPAVPPADTSNSGVLSNTPPATDSTSSVQSTGGFMGSTPDPADAAILGANDSGTQPVPSEGSASSSMSSSSAPAGPSQASSDTVSSPLPSASPASTLPDLGSPEDVSIGDSTTDNSSGDGAASSSEQSSYPLGTIGAEAEKAALGATGADTQTSDAGNDPTSTTEPLNINNNESENIH
jgi:hypothetical protein